MLNGWNMKLLMMHGVPVEIIFRRSANRWLMAGWGRRDANLLGGELRSLIIDDMYDQCLWAFQQN